MEKEETIDRERDVKVSMVMVDFNVKPLSEELVGAIVM